MSKQGGTSEVVVPPPPSDIEMGVEMGGDVEEVMEGLPTFWHRNGGNYKPLSICGFGRSHLYVAYPCVVKIFLVCLFVQFLI